LPDNGRSYELVDGWLIELAPSTRHGFLARRLGRILERAAEAAKAGANPTNDHSRLPNIARRDIGVALAEEDR
jgi:hypothetical protein